MGFPFYPKHEFGCEHVAHCPHLGGAALGSVVLLANQNHDTCQAQLRTIDQTVPVPAPNLCPLCGGEVRVYEDYEADEHLQEDIIDDRRQVTCFVHPAARCRTCRRCSFSTT